MTLKSIAKIKYHKHDKGSWPLICDTFHLNRQLTSWKMIFCQGIRAIFWLGDGMPNTVPTTCAVADQRFSNANVAILFWQSPSKSKLLVPYVGHLPVWIRQCTGFFLFKIWKHHLGKWISRLFTVDHTMGDNLIFF